jgi:hypothetical protein
MTAEKKLKLPTRLVDIQRQEPWWHDQKVFRVPTYQAPAINGSRIGVILGPLVYCVDADYDYANVWELSLNIDIADSSQPRWWGKDKLLFAALLRDGRYQSILVDSSSSEVRRRTLMKGKPYNDFYMFEDRWPLQPVVVRGDCHVIDPYGHVYSYTTKKTATLTRNIRVQYEPCVMDNQIVLHIAKSGQRWVEWRDGTTFKKLLASKRFTESYGITTGYSGTAPTAVSGSVVCGLGNHLVCFDERGQVVWDFTYPRIQSWEGGEPIRATTTEGETIYESRSEVTITSNIYVEKGFLYFVVSECTRHISFVTKLSSSTGDVVWTCQIKGLSGGFSIVDVSAYGLLLQESRSLWLIAEDGSIRKEMKLELDCAGCSSLTKVGEGRYVVLADMGLYEVQIDLKKLSQKAIVRTTGSARRVFLSHASDDKKAIVQPFYEACERRAISAWLDAAEIRWGDSLSRKIEQGIAKADVVLLFLSRDFLKKPWPRKELEMALSLEVSGRKAVLPLALGLSDEELQSEHPMIASKVYKCIEDYDPSRAVDPKVIERLVRDLEAVLSEI